MQPHETLPSAAGPRSPQRGIFSRFVLPIILLMAIVGGIAWVVQYLPSARMPEKKDIDTGARDKQKQQLVFERYVANWETDAPKHAPDISKDFKEFEPGMKGHYDFPFRNVFDGDVEMGLDKKDCDCTSVLVCTLPESEWQDVREKLEKSPGSPLPYKQKPEWTDLSADPVNKVVFLVKPKEYGIVRLQWTARKLPGQELKLHSLVWAQPAGDVKMRTLHGFGIASTMVAPVRFSPAHASVGVLTSRGVAKAEFDAWSSTRETLDLKLTGPTADPLFTVELRALSDQERADLEYQHVAVSTLNQNQTKRYTTRVLSGYHVTVTVHEQKDDKQLDQGSFYRKLPVFLDGFPSTDVQGPAIVGRVQGGIEIGGGDDQGKIRFKSFSAKAGATKVVELSTDAKLRLEPFAQHPSILEVDLKQNPKDLSRWRLKVTVPPDTFSGSFTDADAVILRIVGDPPRFVRIPIEGNVSDR